MPSKRSATASITTASKRRRIHTSSVWTHKDDWSTLLSDSSLSTSSISVRPPRFRTFPTLTRCASDAVVKGFPSFWRLAKHADRMTKYSGPDEIVREDWERWWKEWWERVPSRLQETVRDNIFKKWGGALSIPVIQEVSFFSSYMFRPSYILHSFSSYLAFCSFQEICFLLLLKPLVSNPLFLLRIFHRCWILSYWPIRPPLPMSA